MFEGAEGWKEKKKKWLLQMVHVYQLDHVTNLQSDE